MPTNSLRNPYIVGSVIQEPTQFFGREEILSEILESNSPQFCVLGVRRIGKTSLLKQIENKYYADNRKIAIFLSLQSEQSAESMGLELHRSILRALSKHSILRGFSARQEQRHLNEVMREWIDFSDQYHLQSILLIDEAEKLKQLDPDDLDQFRAFFERESSMSIVITGSRFLRSIKINSKSPVNLLSTFEIRMLSIFREQEAVDLISQNGKVSAGPHTISAIQKFSGQHPFLIQFIAQKLYQNGQLEQLDSNMRALTLSKDLFTILDYEYQRLTESEILIMRKLSFTTPTSLQQLQQDLKFQEDRLLTDLLELEELGFIRYGQNQYFLGNVFWQKYLELDL